jgi:hypothetical protein
MRAIFIVCNLVIMLAGIAFSMFDSKQRHPTADRAHLLALVMQVAVLLRILVNDRFKLKVMFYERKECVLYCSDTRQLALSCVTNATIFSLCVPIQLQILVFESLKHFAFLCHIRSFFFILWFMIDL